MTGVIVTGAGGQLGRAFIEGLSFREGYSIFSFDRRQLDITDPQGLEALITTLPQIKFWINCAAYTKVDAAETHPEEAFLINAEASRLIARSCAKSNVHLFHFSSDYVYDNALTRPLQETDPTTPRGVYAKSKLQGEVFIQDELSAHTIIRTSWVYGHGGHNFVNTMLKLGAQKSELNIVNDQLGAPTYTADIVRAVKSLMMTWKNEDKTHAIEGVFNFANQGAVTWADFARTIFKHAGLSCQVNNISTETFNAPAPRPKYSVLDCAKIQPILDHAIPAWEDALIRYLGRENQFRS